jgi:hypothetical protein
MGRRCRDNLDAVVIRNRLRVLLVLLTCAFAGCAEGELLNPAAGGASGQAGTSVASGGAGSMGDGDGATSDADVSMMGPGGSGGTAGSGGGDAAGGAGGSGGSAVIPDADSDRAESGDAASDRFDAGGRDASNDARDGGGGAGDARDSGPDVEAGPLAPCSGLCPNPIVFTTPYNAVALGPLGTAATCHQTTTPLQGFVCGNFAAPRIFAINGAQVVCSGGAQTLTTPRNGGYCFQATAGNETSEYFMTF